MKNKQGKFNFLDEDGENLNEILDQIEDSKTGNKKEYNNQKQKKIHYSFEARIITSIIIVILLFSSACFLIYKVVNYTADYKVDYTEITNTNYEVCLKNNTCEKENEIYKSDEINTIKVAFAYNRNYSKKIKYNVGYHVTVITRAYNQDRTIVYAKERILVDNAYTTDYDKRFDIKDKVSIDFSKYRDELKEYALNDTECEVIFYIDDINETGQISSIIIPLSYDEFGINIKDTLNLDRSVMVAANVWDKYSIIMAIISSILIFACLIIVYKTTRLLLKVTNNRSLFQQEVDNILKEYDNIIVVARDGYETNVEREIVKIDNFSELLKIQNDKNKPIIYSRVNDIKSEFLIEDEKLYKLTMKESDFE